MNSDIIRVIIIDDHPVVREGIAAMINRRQDMSVVAEGSSGQDAITLHAEYQPDIILLDLRMPVMDGVAAIEHIRTADPDAHIIVLTTYDSDEDIYQAIRAGAMAYLLKDTPRADLLDTIRAVHAGRKRIPPEVAARLAERLNTPTLTERELEVLGLIAKGMSNRQVGQALTIAEGTVKAHVNNILTKLDASDRTQAVTTALQRGIIRL